METEVPTWVDNLRWVVVAFLLAMAYVGPKILGPVLDRFRQQLPTQSATLANPSRDLAVIGGAFADRDTLQQLVEVLGRIADLLETKFEHEAELSQEAKTRKMMQELLRELGDVERNHDKHR